MIRRVHHPPLEALQRLRGLDEGLAVPRGGAHARGEVRQRAEIIRAARVERLARAPRAVDDADARVPRRAVLDAFQQPRRRGALSQQPRESTFALVFDDALEHGGQMGLHGFVFFWGLIA